MSDYFTKKDAEEFKGDMKKYVDVSREDFQHFLNLLFSGNQPKMRYVIDAQMNLKQEARHISDSGMMNLRGELSDGMSELYHEVLDIMKEHGNLVVAQIRITHKLDNVIEKQREIKNKLTAYAGSWN